MNLKEFDYYLPKNLIAQKPIKPRDHSRLLVLKRRNPETAEMAVKIEHKRFYDIADYFKQGDVLVLNNSKVFPARLIGKKERTGGKIEVFLLNALRGVLPLKNKGNTWNCLLGGHGRKEGLKIRFGKKLRCEVKKNNNDGTWEVKFNLSVKKMMEVIEKIGHTPLPPYIKRPASKENAKDKKDYQTIYANKNKFGSAAAPTAGFHFTSRLIKKLKKKGVQFEYITLHVGLGTFSPVKEEDIRKHKMHPEWAEISRQTTERILKAKKEGRRIIAVGTTSARALESALNKKGRNGFSGWVNIFIYPGYKFKIIDALITNFHLPKSTLLMLVSAFAGKKNIKKAYETAVRRKYRFYSFGDAMLIF